MASTRRRSTLFSASAVESFALEAFNTGDYYRAVEQEVAAETVSELFEESRCLGAAWRFQLRPNLEISRGCGLDRRNEWRKVLLAWDDTRC